MYCTLCTNRHARQEFRIISRSDRVLLDTADLHQRKQQWMRRMIMDAALGLFVKQGFDDTTVDQIADAAGISRRSFFRYFANKGDLLAHEVVTYGLVLSEAIAHCPGGYSPTRVLEETVLRLAASAEVQPHTRSTIQIAERSAVQPHGRPNPRDFLKRRSG